MAGKGTVTEHKMFAKGDPGSGWGSNEGRIARLRHDLLQLPDRGRRANRVCSARDSFTADPIEDGFFGCGGVAEIPDLQNKLIKLARGGFKHHTTVGVGHMQEILEEAFGTYLGYNVVNI